MDLNLNFLKIEIIWLLLSFLYFFYYIFSEILAYYKKVREVFWKRKQAKQENQPIVTKVKTDDENEHLENYDKSWLSYEDKLKIADLLKKARVNITMKDYELAKLLIVEGLSIDKFNKDLNF